MSFIQVIDMRTEQSAMENSNLPETAEFAEEQMPPLDGPPTFYDLDVIQERT